MGDGATLYIQIDSVYDAFRFNEVDANIADSLNSVLSDNLKQRKNELDKVVDQLDISLRLSDEWLSCISFADIPFHLSIGNDVI